MAGASENLDMGGSRMQEDVLQPSTEDRLQQAMLQIELMRQEANQLMTELNQLKRGKDID